MSGSSTDFDSERDRQCWSQYQHQHDVSGRMGQTRASIRPAVECGSGLPLKILWPRWRLKALALRSTLSGSV
jgi:hypothetical protein